MNWPTAAAIVFLDLFALLIFRKPITNLIDQVRSFGSICYSGLKTGFEEVAV